MKHLLREGALNGATTENERNVTAPWFLDLNGQPLPLPIRSGEVGVYLEAPKILHIRNDRTGTSRTITPTVDVTIDHSASFFELQFLDPKDRLSFLPSISLDDNRLVFFADGDLNGWTFSNRAMFETFCDFMASPIYNPFETPIPTGTSGLCGDVQKRMLFYQALEADDIDQDDDEDDIDPYLGREDEYPIDEKYCFFVSCHVETDRPIKAWDRIERSKTKLPPGKYFCEVTRWDRETGEPEQVKLEGKSKTGERVNESFLEWAILAREIELAHAHVDAVRERKPFDPSNYRPVTLHEAQAPKPASPDTGHSELPIAKQTQPKTGILDALRKFIGK
ncbi:hypothetical protein [Pseudochrobactrum asaccharolyticum]|uniref:Uncharacterized protein n=1 Tax=Pseudochrobactrum asaccharolyticum TaxID=354351 RepID=A0A366DHG1_9HYPH|nr:hypothetical protein [Pseudochrobactrum asaccharolyticum]RBO88774.1 hypothetical protein DFR47_11815 [Pseudochrobactrum asaccharolyticum]